MPNWTRDYVRQIDNADNTRGNLVGRIHAIGVNPLKIGRLPVNNNYLYSAERYTKQATLVRMMPFVSGAAGGTGTVTPRAFVHSPSNRLRCAIYVVFEPDSSINGDPTFIVQPTWSVRSMSKNPVTGVETPMQVVYPVGGGVTNLPDGYEFDSADPLIRVDMTTIDTAFAVSYLPITNGGEWKLIVTWEPNGPIENDEKNRLFSQCGLSVGATYQLYNNAT